MLNRRWCVFTTGDKSHLHGKIRYPGWTGREGGQVDGGRM